MQHVELTHWCIHAVQKIKYPPDREKVYLELRQHLDDRCEDFLAQGMDEDSAAKKACEVMGDPYEIADYLAAIHRPFWGYAYSITKLLCIALAVWTLLVIVLGALFSFSKHYRQPDYGHFDPYANTALSDRTNQLYLEPGSHFSDSFWHVTLEKASLWRTTSGNFYFYFQLNVHDQLLSGRSPDFLSFISARDNLGREYVCPNKRSVAENDRYVSLQIYNSSPFTHIVDAELGAFDPDGVKWLDVLYECDGKCHSLRIDLTGGDAK